MNNTNRVLNRAVILAAGIVLFGTGLAVSVLMPLQQNWQSGVGAARLRMEALFAASPFFATGQSWIPVGVTVALALTVALFALFILRQGHGRTQRLIREQATEHGVTVVDAAVAEQFLADALTDQSEAVSSAVTTFNVKGAPTLRVTVTARRGVSPRDVARSVEQATRALDAVLGQRIPTVVHIVGGIRARTAGRTRLL